MDQQELRFEGCNFFRQRLAYSLLSGRAVAIAEIRSYDDEPGIKDFESKLLLLLEKITNGTRIRISQTGTKVEFSPGVITGGQFTFDCGNDRCISYYLEPLLMLAPFCKHQLNLKLQGITNAPSELSVDAIRVTWLPVFNKFVVAPNLPEIKVVARGYKPNGGGYVLLTAPTIRIFRPVQCKTVGKICKIRGIASVSKVSLSIAHRMINASKETLRDYIADIYITVDQRKGASGGSSPGFGLFLTAETTFMEWAIDEDDPTCITITLLCEERYTRKSFQLYLMIDWSEPNTFPRAFTSSVPEYLQNLRLDEWDSSSIFADNLNRIFRNLISSNFVY